MPYNSSNVHTTKAFQWGVTLYVESVELDSDKDLPAPQHFLIYNLV